MPTVSDAATSPEAQDYPMRVQRFLARAGAASRRGSENLMTAGRVRVNGEVVTELGSKVDPRVDVVTVDGIEYHLADSATFLLLNKPAGYVTTMRDPQGRPCVADLVPTRRFPGLFAVGRLDRDTTGALLFTTDGDVAQELLHPSHHVDKRYVALVGGEMVDAELEPLRRGIELDDGPTSPAEAHVLASGTRLARTVAPNGVPRWHTACELVIHEGRKHQVKRMLAAVGHRVVMLHRDSFGPIALGDLEEGSWRSLTAAEVASLSTITEGR